MIKKTEWKTHPLKWEDLVDTVKKSGMKNPDICIEDCTRYGKCTPDNTRTIDLRGGEETDYIEASFSTICVIKQNLIIIRHHF